MSSRQTRSRNTAPAEFTTYYERDRYFTTADIETALVSEPCALEARRLQVMLDDTRNTDLY